MQTKLYAIHSKIDTVHRSPYTVQYVLYSVHCIIGCILHLQQGVKIIGAAWKLRVFCNKTSSFISIITRPLIIKITQLKKWLVEKHFSFSMTAKFHISSFQNRSHKLLCLRVFRKISLRKLNMLFYYSFINSINVRETLNHRSCSFDSKECFDINLASLESWNVSLQATFWIVQFRQSEVELWPI